MRTAESKAGPARNASEFTTSQDQPGRRPLFVEDGIGGHAAIRFDGQRRFLHLPGSPITSPDCTILAIVTDRGAAGHREIVSNWSAADGNIGTSIFLGLTAEAQVRWTDQFADAGTIRNRERPFLITSSQGERGAFVHQNGRLLGEHSPLTDRRIDTPWVIGQQGNINGEYWHGDLACLLIYDRQLSAEELRLTSEWLLNRYQIPSEVSEDNPQDPETLAWASLAVVLFNTNEFLYVD